MTITEYMQDPRFERCARAFLVTGAPEHDNFNRVDNLLQNRSGNWKFSATRVCREGDLLFFLLPNPNSGNGYPREIHVGILNRLPERQSGGRVVFHVDRFDQLEDIESNVVAFLEGNRPPQGDTVLCVWDKGKKDIPDEDDESGFPEGAASYQLHLARERDRDLIRRAKRKRLSETGRLACEVCNSDFFATYGERGLHFIEAHHTTPVAALNGRRKTKIKELAMVCSNCHRMLHRKPSITVASLREQVLFRRQD